MAELANRPSYKEAKLYDCNGEVSTGTEWYFYFYILEDGVYKRYRERFDINRIRGKSDAETRKLRYAYGKLIIHQIKEWLKSGEKPVVSKPKTIAVQENVFTVRKAIEYAMTLKGNKNLRQRSMQTYQNSAARFLEYASEANMSTLPITELSKKHIQAYSDHLAASRKIGNLSVNKYVNMLRTILTELVDREIIPKNPCSNMGKLKEQQGERNIPLTTDELMKLRTELPTRHRRLWLFSLLIYYGYLRSQEICQLKAGMIDFQNGFHLPCSKT